MKQEKLVKNSITEKKEKKTSNTIRPDKSLLEAKKALDALSKENDLFSQFFWQAPFIENLSAQKQEKIWNDACTLLQETKGDPNAIRQKIADNPDASKSRETTTVFLICYLYANSKKSDWDNVSENFGSFKAHMQSQKSEISNKALTQFMQTQKVR